MSGYLRRLVETTREPAETIHPIVGTLFSPVGEETIPPTIAEPSEGPRSNRPASSSDATPPSQETSRTLFPDPQPDHRAESTEPLAAPHFTVPAPPAPEFVSDSVDDEKRLLMPPATVGSVTDARSVTRNLGPAPTEELTGALTSTEPRDESETPLDDPQPRGDSRSAYRPLIIGKLEAVPPTDEGHSKPVPLGPRRRPTASEVGRPEVAERQPDEIQIHIGRIEVTAVPPPVAAPAARPVRKSQSLDDYLKRRDGRTA